jgi:hypothetical protein
MKRIISISVIALVLLSGCTKNRFISNERIAPISLTANFGQPATKAIITDDNITSQIIRVQVSKSNGTESYDVLTPSKYKLSYSGQWSLSQTLYLSAENAKIYAYAPSPTDEAIFPQIESGQYNTLKRKLDIPASQPMANQVDYLWCYQDKTQAVGGNFINSTYKNVTLTMEHALSQIAFVIYGENYNGNGEINSVKIKDNSGTPALKIMKSGENDLYMSVLTGGITGGETTAEISATSIGGSILTAAPVISDIDDLKAKVNAYLLIVPTSVANKANVQFSFNIDNKDYSVSLTGSGVPISWVAGQQYIYSVKLSGSALELIGVTVTKWTPFHDTDLEIN